MRLVQLAQPELLRYRVAVVEEPRLRLLDNCETIYQMSVAALRQGRRLEEFAANLVGSEALDYDPIYHGFSDWRVSVPVIHPQGDCRVLVSGTGLTHRRSAANRQAMHSETAPVTDSMRMYEWGEQGGRPEPGKIGVQPEWFYKGNGYSLRGHGEPLIVPPYAEDGGEEAEIAGVYLGDPGTGAPFRLGFVLANEFSDHQMERRNYLYLAPSKLRCCAIGPELVLGDAFEDVRGHVRIERGSDTIWSKAFASGEANMCHSLANLEHHHFKYQAHRMPDMFHVHFFGADAFSFGDGVRLDDGDLVEISAEGFGRALRNPVRLDRTGPAIVQVGVL